MKHTRKFAIGPPRPGAGTVWVKLNINGQAEPEISFMALKNDGDVFSKDEAIKATALLLERYPNSDIIIIVSKRY